MTTIVIVAVVAALAGAVAGAMIGRLRSHGQGCAPYDDVARLAENLVRGLAGEDVSRALEQARATTGVQSLRLTSGPTVETSRTATRVDLRVDGVVRGALVADGADRGAISALEGLAWLIQCAAEAEELHAARKLQTQAELLALKAQIRPHFIYNALNVIASFTITDPERARALLIEFADFTRYWFREPGALASLGDELRAIEGYLTLERARYGDRLSVRLQVSPESLSTRVPHLSLQPLVENAVRHGIESVERGGSLSITAYDEGALTIVTIEDDGVGMDPQRLAHALAGELSGVHIGLRNVDTRLRETYGDAFGLVVHTAPGAGTLITVRVPKFSPLSGSS